MVEKLTVENFDSTLAEAQVPVLVDCYADWCGPCKMMAPVVDEIAAKYAGKLKVCKINVDDEMAIARKFRVMSIPTFLFFKDGELVKRSVGGMEPEAFEEAVEEVLG